MKVCFSGTRDGMTEEQRVALRELMNSLPVTTLLHGDCVGADGEAHLIAKELGAKVEVYPPSSDYKRAFCQGAQVVHPAAPYLIRNRYMVRDSSLVIAAPKDGDEVIRSGTWATVRIARKRCPRPVIIIKPDGTLVREAVKV